MSIFGPDTTLSAVAGDLLSISGRLQAIAGGCLGASTLLNTRSSGGYAKSSSR